MRLKAERALQTTKAALLRTLRAARKPLIRKVLRTTLRSTQRNDFDPAAEELASEGLVTITDDGVRTTYALTDKGNRP